MSIRTRLIVVLIGVLFSVSLSAGAIVYWQNAKILNSHIGDDLRSTNNYTSQIINSYIGYIETSLNALAKDARIIKALEDKDAILYEQASQIISAIRNGNKAIENISVMEVKGSACIPRAANIEGLSAIGRDFSDRDYCKGIIATEATYLSSAYMSSINNNPVLGLVVPVKNVVGEMLGFVYASINIDDLRGYLWDLQEDSKIELLDRYGTLFLNTEEKIVLLGSLIDGEVSELSTIQDKISNDGPEGYYRDADVFIGYKKNGSITIIYEKSATSLLGLSSSLSTIILISAFLTIVIVFFAVYASMGTVIKRLSRLSTFSEEVAKGNLATKLEERDLKAKDETAALARSFNDMATKLKHIYDNLDEKVLEKTSELEKSNHKLTESLLESEKANRAMVSRELEMVALKERIKQLENH